MHVSKSLGYISKIYTKVFKLLSFTANIDIWWMKYTHQYCHARLSRFGIVSFRQIGRLKFYIRWLFSFGCLFWGGWKLNKECPRLSRTLLTWIWYLIQKHDRMESNLLKGHITKALTQAMLLPNTVPTFNSCTKWVGIPCKIRPLARLPTSFLGMDAWMTSQLKIALVR